MLKVGFERLTIFSAFSFLTTSATAAADHTFFKILEPAYKIRAKICFAYWECAWIEPIFAPYFCSIFFCSMELDRLLIWLTY